MRQIVLDTETTGLEPSQGHRIIEIGCVELFNRRLTGNHYHQYVNPERDIDQGALEVHGISSEFLADKPVFANISDEFLAFVDGAELIIHNAPFDTGFIDHELKRLGHRVRTIGSICSVIDSLALARQKHPGQKNSLDALCKRYMIDNSRRALHGALLDSEILADVYLAMTGGQTALHLGGVNENNAGAQVVVSALAAVERLSGQRAQTPLSEPSASEMEAHDAMLDVLQKKSSGACLWLADSHSEKATGN